MANKFLIRGGDINSTKLFTAMLDKYCIPKNFNEYQVEVDMKWELLNHLRFTDVIVPISCHIVGIHRDHVACQKVGLTMNFPVSQCEIRITNEKENCEII